MKGLTFAIGHSGSNHFERTGIKTLLGAKRIAKQLIQQSFGGHISIHAENHDVEYGPERFVVSMLYGHDDKWTDLCDMSKAR